MRLNTCIDTHAPRARRSHAWQSTGLDIIDAELCNTRKCYLCGAEQHKPYGRGERGAWKTTQPNDTKETTR